MARRLPLASIKLRDPFWLAWQKAFLEKGLEHQFRQCEETGRFENFRRATRGDSTGHQGYYFNDSDVYKWLEAASYAISAEPQWEGAAMVDGAIALVAAAQAPDGYIGTPFQVGQMDDRWKALTSRHEMYCIGHLIEAGVAHFEATGTSSLLDVARKAADHVVDTFGPGKRKGYCGHEEIELAFCRLTEATGDPRYASLAKWMVETRGSRPSPFVLENEDPVGKDLNKHYEPLVSVDGVYTGAYFQDDVPLVRQTEAVGHAVRAMYFFCGAADASDTQETRQALETIWSNLVRKRMYVTGGIGSAGRNEGFTNDFDLPNREAYAETCAAIGLVFWASRMSRLSGASYYADVMELALYNAALSGVNFDTDRYFYVNPLESRGDHMRQPWFGCACCPPNIARLVMSVQQYAAFQSDDGLTIDLPISAEYEFEGSGVKARVSVESSYPWMGAVTVRVLEGGAFTLKVRIPQWQRGFVSSLNGQPCDTYSDGYLVVERDWEAGDCVELNVPMKPEWLACDPQVADNIGRVALRKGPIVYCLEESDLGLPVHLFRPDVSEDVEPSTNPDARTAETLLVSGVCDSVSSQVQLYVPAQSLPADTRTVKFVPYFSWSNRAPGSMAVWFRQL